MSKYTVFIRVCMVSIISLILMGCSARAKAPDEVSTEISTGAAAETPTETAADTEADALIDNTLGSEGSSSMTGLCLISDDGQYLIVDKQGIPIVMSNQSDSDNLFSSLQTWDKIEITYDGIQETYPAQTGVYTCRLIEKSSTDMIPENTLSQLQQLGWSFPISCE